MRRLLLACVAGGLVNAASAAQGPCIMAAPGCTEMIGVPGTEARALVYRSYPLDARNPGITRAVIMVHGYLRDAADHFRWTLAAAFLAGALDDTLIVAPRFPSGEGGPCGDAIDPGELAWHCQTRNDSWHVGGGAVNGSTTTFDVVDGIVRGLARKDTFPNLRAIVIAGHSGGGQFAVRYAMSNTVYDTAGVKVSYLVANPSSYTYPDEARPTDSSLRCAGYDDWPYGMRARTGYASKVSDERMRKNLVDRPATIVLGELDTLPLYGFDRSCAAMAQGPDRRARGVTYAKYVNEKYGARYATVLVHACGHSARCVLTSDEVLPLLFPK